MGQVSACSTFGSAGEYACKLGTLLALLFVFVTVSSQTASAQFTDTGGGDHGGADYIPATGTLIAGVHTNIGTFRVSAGATVLIAAFDGVGFGTLEIHACNIDIQGTLDGVGAGFRGGVSGTSASCDATSCGLRGEGTGGGGGTGQLNCCDSGAGGGGGYGGAGGAGGGPSFRAPCLTLVGCDSSACWGLSGPANGDAADTTVLRGSGGGAGGGLGLGGGRGGAAISLLATATGTFSITGTINVTGTAGADSPAGLSDNADGGGSGGTILLQGGTITGAGVLRADGGVGGSGALNTCFGGGGGGGAGGRIKVFAATDGFTGLRSVAGASGGAASAGNAAGAAGAAGSTNASATQPLAVTTTCVPPVPPTVVPLPALPRGSNGKGGRGCFVNAASPLLDAGTGAFLLVLFVILLHQTRAQSATRGRDV